jgi:non-homologous end joining protein Ku
LYPAVASEGISFRQVKKQTGNRLRQQLVDVVTGEPVQAHNKGRGYEVGENQFLVVRDDELEAAEQEGRGGRTEAFQRYQGKSTRCGPN